jgi:hypothetical protein
MTEVVLSLYALCGIVTFWAVFAGAASATDVDAPTPNAAAAVSLAASVVWPALLLGVLQLWVLAVIGNVVAPRPA